MTNAPGNEGGDWDLLRRPAVLLALLVVPAVLTWVDPRLEPYPAVLFPRGQSVVR